MCVLGATTIWFFTALNKNYTTTINYPLQLNYPGSDSLVVVGNIPQNLRINVTAGGWDLLRNSLGIGVKPVQYDLRNPLDTRYLLGISLISAYNDQVKSLKLNQVITDTLYYHIEPPATKNVMVTVNLETAIDPQHIMVGSLSAEPATLEVRGPLSMVRDLPDTLVLELSQSGIRENYQERVALVVDQQDLNWDQDYVNVAFKVDPLMSLQSEVLLETRNFPDEVQVDSSQLPLMASYQIPSSYQDSLQQASIKCWVDFADLQSDSVLYPSFEVSHSWISNLALNHKKLSVVYVR